MRTQLRSALLATSLACAFFAAPAQAQAPRTFVSAAGNDSNPCSFAAPCRHFQAAVNATSAGGEVDALDPAGYGPIVVSQAITIEGQGWSYIAPPVSGNGITINAVSGNVAIHGVSINGVGITGDTNGIVFNSGGSLTVADSVLRNFAGSTTTGNGILIQPTSGTVSFVITNTIVSNNGGDGIRYFPPSGSPSANGVIDHVVANANTDGITVNTFNASGGTTVVTISNTITNDNVNGSGVVAVGVAAATVKVSADNVSVSGNFFGIQGSTTANVLLSRSVITGNSVGILNNTSPNTFYTYKNNQINLNGSDLSTALNTTFALQ